MNASKKTIVRNTVGVIAAAVSASLLGGIIYGGYQSYASATAKPEVVSNYTSTKPVAFPASDFVEKMVESSVEGTDKDIKPVPVATAGMLPDSCIEPEVPKQVVYSKAASNKDYSIVVQAYGAGQAKMSFSSYAKTMELQCGIKLVQDGNTASWDGGAFLTSGDALISVQVKDSSRRDDIVSKIKNRMEELLHSTSCSSLAETSSDARRSFYYDSKTYEGLSQTEQVSTSKKVISASVPQSYADANGNVEAMYQAPTTRLAPESPLPSGMEASIPTAPSTPDFQTMPSVPSSTTDILYQVSDEQGPGCGWVWSGQSVPHFNASVLNKGYRETKSRSIDGLDKSVLSYNGVIGAWSLDSLWKTRFIVTWNKYLHQVDDVQKKWNDLDAKRSDFRPTWTAYIDSVYKWEKTRLQIQQETDAWNQKVSDCAAQKQKEWMSDNPGKTMTDDQKTSLTEACKASTPKTSLMSQKIGDEPTAPTIPSDMTIPSSWDTAATAKSRAKSEVDAETVAKKKAESKKKEEEQKDSSTSTTKPDASTSQPNTQNPDSSDTDSSDDDNDSEDDSSGVKVPQKKE